MRKNLLKNILKITVIVILLIIYTYMVAIENIPSNIVIFEGEKLSLNTLLGISLNIKDSENTVETYSNSKNKQQASVNLFNNIEIKKMNIDVLPKTTVIPVGNIAGLKLYTSGVLVVGMTEIKGMDNKKHKPFQNTGIEEGDRIISIENEHISTVNDLTKEVNNSQGKNIKVQYIHKEETKECSITPVQTGKSEYKLGLWVRDSTAGVGTVTFYEPSTKMFAALGHGITDIDTGDLIKISSGQFVTSKILNITKGVSRYTR